MYWTSPHDQETILEVVNRRYTPSSPSMVTRSPSASVPVTFPAVSLVAPVAFTDVLLPTVRLDVALPYCSVTDWKLPFIDWKLPFTACAVSRLNDDGTSGSGTGRELFALSAATDS